MQDYARQHEDIKGFWQGSTKTSRAFACLDTAYPSHLWFHDSKLDRGSWQTTADHCPLVIIHCNFSSVNLGDSVADLHSWCAMNGSRQLVCNECIKQSPRRVGIRRCTRRKSMKSIPPSFCSCARVLQKPC